MKIASPAQFRAIYSQKGPPSLRTPQGTVARDTPEVTDALRRNWNAWGEPVACGPNHARDLVGLDDDLDR
jgi:hypothetical protein